MLPLLAALLLISGVNSNCYQANQTYDVNTWPVIYIISSFDETHNPIPGQCTYTANTNDPSLGFGKLDVSSCSEDGWQITISDTSGSHKCTPQNCDLVKYATTSSNISVSIVTNNKNTCMATLVPVPIGTIKPTPPPTTPYTPDVDSPPNNPAEISVDIAFLLDFAAGPSNKYDIRKELLVNIGKQLTFTSDYKNKDKSRYMLAGLNNIVGSFGPYGPIWGNDSNNFTNMFLSGPMPGKSSWQMSIEKILDHAFTINGSDVVTPTREHSQRVMMIIYSDTPKDDINDIIGLKEKFQAKDVVPVFVYVNDGNPDKNFDFNGTFTVINVSNSSDASASQVLTNSIDVGNNLCGVKLDGQDYKGVPIDLDNLKDSKAVQNIKVPSDDNNQIQTNGTWNVSNQKARYCNFYTATYNLQTNKKYICFQIYYEIEVEKDMLRIYSNDIEYVSLSGIDVSGSLLHIEGTPNSNWAAQVVFSTDSHEVYGGFNLNTWSTDEVLCKMPS